MVCVADGTDKNELDKHDKKTISTRKNTHNNDSNGNNTKTHVFDYA